MVEPTSRSLKREQPSFDASSSERGASNALAPWCRETRPQCLAQLRRGTTLTHDDAYLRRAWRARPNPCRQAWPSDASSPYRPSLHVHPRCLPSTVQTTLPVSLFGKPTALLPPVTPQWRRWAMSSSASSTGCRTWSSTPLETTPSISLRLYVVLWRPGPCGSLISSTGRRRLAVVRKVVRDREHRRQRLSPSRKRHRDPQASGPPAYQPTQRTR